MAQRFVQHFFNNPFKEVIKDDGNVEKQKKGEKESYIRNGINN